MKLIYKAGVNLFSTCFKINFSSSVVDMAVKGISLSGLGSTTLYFSYGFLALGTYFLTSFWFLVFDYS